VFRSNRPLRKGHAQAAAVMTNYLSVEKEKVHAARIVPKEKSVGTDHLKKSLKSNEQRLLQLAAAEKARRDAGSDGSDLPKRMAALPTDQLPPLLKPAPPKSNTPPSRDARSHASVDPDEVKHAAFRALAMKQPIGNLRRMCDEIGIPSSGDRHDLVDRLAAHARQHHGLVRAQQSGAAVNQNDPPPTASSAVSTSSRRQDNLSRPSTGLSIASLSLEPETSAGQPAPAHWRPPATPPPPSTAQSVQSFVAADSFDGARRGQVFKADGRGLGYYRDR